MKKLARGVGLILFASAGFHASDLMAGAPGDRANPSTPTKSAIGVLKVQRPVPGEYNVVFNKSALEGLAAGKGQSLQDVTKEVANILASKHGLSVQEVWGHALQGMAIRANEAQARALAKNPNVSFVEENGQVNANITQTGATWGLDRIDQRNLPLDSLYNYSNTASNVTAYIIDTGILTSHVDFGGRASVGYDALGGTGQDCNGHGTHVAGTVGGNAYGVAKGIKLKAVRVLDCTGSGTNTGVISGINWVTANKTLPAVANMSLGGGYSSALNSAVANSIAAGITYAVAAGNSNRDACLESPSSTSTAITVGATTNTDARASYSNYGTCLDLFAPGSSIKSDWYSSTTATSIISGTSMASPHVAGAAALYLSANPSATPASVTAAIKNSTTPNKVTSAGTGSPNLLLYSASSGGGDTTPPTVSLASPTSGQVLSGSAVTLSANAADIVAVSRVDFYAGANLLGSDTTSPYSIAWNSASIANGTYNFTAVAVDSSGNATTSSAVSATVSNTGACSSTSQIVLNSGFESGVTSWTASSGVITNNSALAKTGSWEAWLNGYGTTSNEVLYQTVTVPTTACTATLNLWLKVSTQESTTSVAYDRLSVSLRNSAGSTLATLGNYSNLNASSGYVLKSFNLIAYKGQQIRIYVQGTEDSSLATSFFLDDFALNVTY